MRLTSEIWVGVWLRRVQAEGRTAVIVRKGSREAGAIFIKVNRLDGLFDLYAPAPQSVFDDSKPADRLFSLLLDGVAESAIDERCRGEIGFDPDVWILEIDTRDGAPMIEVVESGV